MECNKDEATRAKEISETKFIARDMAGAKKFALKARSLYPGLEGMTQMLATLDVYVSAENKVNGEPDWYGVLGVVPTADEETVRRQYRKLALMLHPDKNKSIGAEGAFKLISQAWSLLSDKVRRVAYDQKRFAKTFQKVPKSTGASSATPRANSFYNFDKTTNTTATTNTSAKSHRTTDRARHSSQKTKPNTFWTVCHRCKMQYEYLRVYLNHNLLCPNCQKPFFAIEIAPPPSDGTTSSTPWNFSQQQQSSNQVSSKDTMNSGRSNAPSSGTGVGGFSGHDSYMQNNAHWSPFSRTSSASTAAQAASVVQQAYEKVKREREEAQAATKREEALRRKQVSRKNSGMSSTGYTGAVKRRKGMDDLGGSNHGRDVTNQMGMAIGGAGAPFSKQANFGAVSVNGFTRPNATREMTELQVHKILIMKARREIQKNIDSATIAKTAGKGERNGNDDKTSESVGKVPVDGGTNDKTKSRESVDPKKEYSAAKSFPGIPSTDGGTSQTLSMTVLDPDFHDFDKDRTEKSFRENHVWAVYDDDDGMPRFYALIQKVISLNPFKMRISWLNSKTNSELGPLNWVASGFSKTCGDFRVGKYEIHDSPNAFSHKVRWTKGVRGVIRIFPRKGDVWALYRNWSPNWNELTADEIIHKYDMVEVLEDYDEEQGVLVIPLVKVAGFRAVFHRHLDLREIRRIPREEMFRFSHQVPSYMLTGHEAPNAPKGCLELDPAATPLDLLQVIADVKAEEIEENDETETFHTKTSEAEITVEPVLSAVDAQDIANMEI
ncbi:uncharacterized protein LOC115681831 [Syzygium oleosum]|uniref:uncharacterized protein LOC115681831 n=1 Tax=Syzygium oleosum TaxID=219896 RepID=UPI0011D25FD6|nr:uncharacterized protein LOC115681831 [Syzygium oleosum]XP_056162356.1 uncharacterized protein LOC115681831 [Syzygium oleosum]